MKDKTFLKRILILIFCVIGLVSVINAFEYVPKNVGQNPFENNTGTKPIQNIGTKTKTLDTKIPQKKEITNLTDYFQYLPHEVNRNWIPYKSTTGYEVYVQFRVHNDGNISDIEIIKSSDERANASVINAVKKGAPYQPLPKSYPADSVKAEVILEYHK